MTKQRLLEIEHELIKDWTEDMWSCNGENAKETMFFINGISYMTDKLLKEMDEERNESVNEYIDRKTH